MRVEREAEGYAIVAEGGISSTAPTLDDISSTLQMVVDLEAQQRSKSFVFLHAGVVSWRGRAIVLPGLSGAGKSTLTLALSRQPGAEYLSDERAPIAEDLRVWPAPVAIAIKDDELGRVGRHMPQSLNLRVAQGPVPVGALVLTAFQADGSWAPRELAAGEALLSLLPHLSSPRSESSLERLHRLVQGVPCYAGDRGAAGEVVRWAVQLW